MYEHHRIDLDAAVEHITGLSGIDRDDWDGAEIARMYRLELAEHLPHHAGLTDSGNQVWYDLDEWHPDVFAEEIWTAELAAVDRLAAQIHDDPEMWTR